MLLHENGGLPYLTLWHTIMTHNPPLVVREDNQAMIRVVTQAKSDHAVFGEDTQD